MQVFISDLPNVHDLGLVKLPGLQFLYLQNMCVNARRRLSLFEGLSLHDTTWQVLLGELGSQ